MIKQTKKGEKKDTGDKSSKQYSYSEAHIRHPEWFEAFYNRMKRAETNLLPAVITVVKENLGDKQKVEIFGVGAGEGDREIPILRELIKDGKDISFDYLDVSKAYFRRFFEKLKKEQFAYILSEKHIIDWVKFKPKKVFDLVFAFHSLYGMKRVIHESLQKIINSLRPGGFAYILQAGEEGLICKFFYDVIGKKIVSGELLTSCLDKMGASYEVRKIRNEIDLSFCVSRHGEEIGSEGQAFLSYILDKDYKSFSQEERCQINNILIRLFKRKDKYIGPVVNNLIILKRRN